MEIKIRRYHTTRLYTMGTLIVNDQRTSGTIEDTLSMLPAGTYPVSLTKGDNRRRLIAILRTSSDQGIKGGPVYHFEPGGTHITSRKHHSVGIGTVLIPGILKEGGVVYERLFDRIEKAEARDEEITLVITDDHMTYSDPIAYWTEPSNHNNN